MSNISFLRDDQRTQSSDFSVHGSIQPDNVYKTDAIKAEVRLLSNSDLSLAAEVFRISPLGIECDVTGLDHDSLGFSVGDSVELTLLLGKQKTMYSGMTIATKHRENERTLLGFRFFVSFASGEVDQDRRRTKRWLCGDEFLPTGIAANPVKFNDYIFFKISDFSSNGMQILTSLRNKTLVKGMVIDCTISLPMVGQTHLNFRIVNARTVVANGKEQLSLGCEYLDPRPDVLSAIGQYTLQFSEGADVVDLKKSGLKVISAAKAMTFGFVKSQNEYEDVLKLRHKAYSEAGKIDQTVDHFSTADIFDSRSRIITARFDKELVGSVRLMFHGADDTMEHEQFVQFPNSFPAKHEIVEVTRVCTEAKFRSSDLFLQLMKQMALLIVQSKRRYMLGSATEKLIPAYVKLGFERTGIKYSHADLGNEEHEILLADIPLLLTGKGISLATWSSVYADVADYLADIHGIDFDPMKNLRMRFYKGIGRILGLFAKK
jgi:predicted GNAT family N-acyltransferase